ncbi:MAG: histidine phosphatase family protein [Alphaproteobacteria bacterium]|nr:histidine phosphatase family protein [Alphaproteobacteria bacterium]
MARIYMVRHGKAAAGFGGHMDPGLDELGKQQAEGAAAVLAPKGPLALLSSPLARARETAAPLAKLWKREPVIEPAVAEIPSPDGTTLEDRVVWLRNLMQGSWRDVPMELAMWREACIAALVAQSEDVAIFSHYVALNVAVGAAMGDDRVTVYSPENCSITVFETDGAKLHLIEKGSEAPLTKVN